MVVEEKIQKYTGNTLETINYLDTVTIKGIIGIDPGKSGGVAVYKGGNTIEAFPCPSDVENMAGSIIDILHNFKVDGIKISNILVAIENVHAFPTDGRSSAFKFGRNFGMWLGIFASNKLKVVQINPFTWMKYFGEMPKVKIERKRYIKKLAAEFFPDARVTLKTSDAILIAKYKFEESEQV